MGFLRRIYFDNNATTPVLPEVLEAMRPFFNERFGNASSIHHHGQETRAAVERARESVAALLGCAVWLVTIVVTVVLPARSRTAGDPRAAEQPGQAGPALRTDDGLATPAAGSARPVPDERRLP